MSNLNKIKLAIRIIEDECQKQGIKPVFLKEIDVLGSDNLGYAMLYLGLIKNQRLVSYVQSKSVSEEVLALCS